MVVGTYQPTWPCLCPLGLKGVIATLMIIQSFKWCSRKKPQQVLGPGKKAAPARYFPRHVSMSCILSRISLNLKLFNITIIPWARVVYELIANEARSTELDKSSYMIDESECMHDIIVLLFWQTRYFWCCVVKQLPDLLLFHFSKTFSHIFLSLLIGYEVITY